MSAAVAAPVLAAPTPRQLECLYVLVEWFDEHGTAPTVKELVRELGLRSNEGAWRLLNGLEERGWIARIRNRCRAIQVLHRPPMPDFGVAFTLSADTLPGHLVAELVAADREYGRCSAA